MLSAVDEGIANVTAALARNGMLDETLLVFTADNGGPTTTGDGVGARNWPLRGGKHSIWEGGVRATAFVHGPPALLPSGGGAAYEGLMHGADWLPTLSSVAGYDLNQTLPLDGVDQWAALSGSGQQSGFPRSSVVLGNSTNDCSWPKGDARRARYDPLWDTPGDVANGSAAQNPGCGFAVAWAQEGRLWKAIRGYGGGPDTWCNSTHGQPSCLVPPAPLPSECPNGWCLYDVQADPNELSEVSQQHPAVLQQLQQEMARVLQSYTQYEPDPACPPHKFVNNTHVGPVWEPWC